MRLLLMYFDLILKLYPVRLSVSFDGYCTINFTGSRCPVSDSLHLESSDKFLNIRNMYGQTGYGGRTRLGTADMHRTHVGL